MIFILDPRALLAGAVALLMTGWIGHATLEGQIVAGTVSGLLFYSVACRRQQRRRIGSLINEIESVSSKAADTRSLLSGVPGIVWRGDAEGNRTYLGDQWEEATGTSVQDSLGRGWLACVHEDDRERCDSTLRMARAGKEHYEVEYRLKQPDGEHRWIVERAAPTFGRRHAFTGYVGIMIDIGQRARRDQEEDATVARLLRLNASINRQAMALADRYEALEKVKESAEFEDRTKCDFLAAFSDDLRPPIAQMTGAIEMLVGPDLDAKFKPHVERIEESAAALGEMLERTVNLSSISEEAERDVEPDRFDLRRLIQDVIDVYHDTAQKNKIALATFVEDKVPTLALADATRIRRLLTELCASTIGAATGGRVTLRVENAGAEGTMVRVRFVITADSGSIPNERVERAFYPARALGGEPAGLGLNVCRRFAELAGGEVGVQREDSGANAFWLALNVVDLNPNWDGRRAHGRLSQESLQSNLGAVLDLSLGGMRVRTVKPQEGKVDIELSDEEETLHLRAEIAWCRRVGFGKHEAGLRFVDVEPETSAQLGRLATRNRLRRVMEAA